jgi:hypothetical protein
MVADQAKVTVMVPFIMSQFCQSYITGVRSTHTRERLAYSATMNHEINYCNQN